MKKFQISIFTIGLTVAISASAQIYTGTALSGLTPSTPYGPSSDSQYVPASGSTPDLWVLYTDDSGDLETSGDDPAVFVQGPLGTLSSFSASYELYGTATGPSGTSPYWILWLTDDPGYTSPIVADGGSILDGSSLVHVGDLTSGSITLAALDSLTDPNSGLAYGLSTVAWAGVEIGDWNNGDNIIPASASFDSITVVPEPTTLAIIAGALLLLPFSRRLLRKTRKA